MISGNVKMPVLVVSGDVWSKRIGIPSGHECHQLIVGRMLATQF